MTATLAHIWRHPIKSIGREALTEITLHKGQTMPWDRTWAVAHEEAQIDGNDWAHCANFARVAKAPELAAVDAVLNVNNETVTLRHPDRPEITLHPERDNDALIDWIAPMMPEDRAQASHIVRAERGMTDSPFPSISIANLASHAQVCDALGAELDPVRWRANLWLDGLEPWAEEDWVGKTVQIGDAVLEIKEQITRCLATAANPQTGIRDADTLGALDGFGHREFGVYGVVTRGGTLRLGETATVR